MGRLCYTDSESTCREGKHMIHTVSPSPAARPSDLKLNNRMQILELFKSGKVYSVADISRQIGISRQTVMKAIQFFMDKGILVSDGKAESGSMGGKRAELYSLSASQYLFSVLISPDSLYIALVNYRNEIIDSFIDPEITVLGIDEILNMTGTACYRLLLNNDIKQRDVRGICVTTSGIVDHSTNVLRFNSLFPRWGRDIHIAERMSSFFDDDVLVLVENVGKVCGSAFLHDRGLQGKRSMTLFSSWGGVCACLMENGCILNGKDALIGEIGHMMLEPADMEVCGCGSHGCFERQVSDDRIRKIVAEAAPRHPDSPLCRKPLQDLCVRDVFAASSQGDALAEAIVDRLARCFAVALRNITLLFNPDQVIFQGDYAAADQRFLDVMMGELRTFNYYEASSPFALQADRRDIRELAALGAYTLLIDRLFREETLFR